MARLEKDKIPFILTMFWFVALWFGFIAVNVNTILGVIYLAVFSIVSMIIYGWDKVKTIPLSKDRKFGLGFVKGIIIYVIFVVIASVLAPLFAKIDIGQLIQLIGTTTPALAESVILNTITFVLFVPFAETMFFIISMDFLASAFNIDISKSGLKKIKTWALLILPLSFGFLMYHITAKGVTNNVALLIVFLMMVFTLGFAIYFGEAKQVVFFHIIANAAGIGLFGALIGNIALMVAPVVIIPLAILIIPKINFKLNKHKI